MMNLKKHSSGNYFIAAALVSAGFFLSNCSRQEKNFKSIIKVNDAILTEEEINTALSENRNNSLYREEYIRNWIETEILFQLASKDGILEDKSFTKLIDKNKKELAASFFLNKLFNEQKFEPTEDELKKYYESNKEEFKLADDAFIINEIHFSIFEKAIQFRKKLLESGWNSSNNYFLKETSVVGKSEQKLTYRYQTQPESLIRMLKNLNPGEVSAVIETQPNIFAVVQLLKKYYKDEIPAFELTRSEIKEKLTVIKKKDFLEKYIDKLISDHNLEIERFTE